MLLRIIHGKVSSTVQQISTQVQRHFPPYVDERRDVTVNNQFVAMKVCLCVFATDMKNYIQLFLYKFGVYNFKIS